MSCILTFQGKNNAKDVEEVERLSGYKFISSEVFKGVANGHRFEVGDVLELYGLEDYPEFDGEIVEVTSIRIDGEHGKAYYFKTTNNNLATQLNWVYECRLRIPVRGSNYVFSKTEEGYCG